MVCLSCTIAGENYCTHSSTLHHGGAAGQIRLCAEPDFLRDDAVREAAEKRPRSETGPWLFAGRLGGTILPHKECGFPLLYNATLLLRHIKMQSDKPLSLP